MAFLMQTTLSSALHTFLCNTSLGTLYAAPTQELFPWHRHRRVFLHVAAEWVSFTCCQHGHLLHGTSTNAFYMMPAGVGFFLCRASNTIMHYPTGSSSTVLSFSLILFAYSISEWLLLMLMMMISSFRPALPEQTSGQSHLSQHHLLFFWYI